MKQKYLQAIIFCFLFMSVAFHQAEAGEVLKATAPEKSSPTQNLMNQLLNQLTALKIYFVSEEKFKDPKNEEIIGAHLKEFARLAKETRHDPMLNRENFKFSQHVLEEHIAETERVFRLGNKSYARWQLASTLAVCTSCHTQMPGVKREQSEFGDYKVFSSGFDQAEFLFATRAFDKAFELYDGIIDGYPKNAYKNEQVENALERQIAYLVRVQRDSEQALEKMKHHQKNKKLPEYLKKNLSAWISQLESEKGQKAPDPKTATDKQIINFTKKNIENKFTTEMMESTNPQLVSYLRVSGILYEYLQNHPNSKAVPEILYWLAICDRSINKNFFFSLADLYLRECMTKYPTSPIAAKCFKEYESETVLGYTGSNGIDVPADVKAELKQLKQYIDSGGKTDRPGDENLH